MSDSTVWKGVLIKESLHDIPLVREIKIVATRITALEEEEDKGQFHFYNVEVLQDDVEEVVTFVAQNIKDSWYFHLVKEGEMIVIFHDKVFRANKNRQEEIEQIRTYALAQGIIAEQLPLEKLFDNPYM